MSQFDRHQQLTISLWIGYAPRYANHLLSNDFFMSFVHELTSSSQEVLKKSFETTLFTTHLATGERIASSHIKPWHPCQKKKLNSHLMVQSIHKSHLWIEISEAESYKYKNFVINMGSNDADVLPSKEVVWNLWKNELYGIVMNHK